MIIKDLIGFALKMILVICLVKGIRDRNYILLIIVIIIIIYINYDQGYFKRKK